MYVFLIPIASDSHASDGRKSTPLHLAAGYNRTRIVEILLQHGADVHAKDKGGLVPLHNACSYGHYEVGGAPRMGCVTKREISILTAGSEFIGDGNADKIWSLRERDGFVAVYSFARSGL